jgi:hypothetical protein
MAEAIDEAVSGRRAKKAERDAAIAAKKQEALIKTQRAEEKQKLAETTSEVERRKALAMKSQGRSLLIKTSPRGVQNLGGS